MRWEEIVLFLDRKKIKYLLWHIECFQKQIQKDSLAFILVEPLVFSVVFVLSFAQFQS